MVYFNFCGRLNKSNFVFLNTFYICHKVMHILTPTISSFGDIKPPAVRPPGVCDLKTRVKHYTTTTVRPNFFVLITCTLLNFLFCPNSLLAIKNNYLNNMTLRLNFFYTNVELLRISIWVYFEYWEFHYFFSDI